MRNHINHVSACVLPFIMHPVGLSKSFWLDDSLCDYMQMLWEPNQFAVLNINSSSYIIGSKLKPEWV